MGARNIPVAIAAALTFALAGCRDDTQSSSTRATDSPYIDGDESYGYTTSHLSEVFGIDAVNDKRPILNITCADTDLALDYYGSSVVIEDAVQCSDGNPQLSDQERAVLDVRRQALLEIPSELGTR